jgi:putative colanic acid biosysnthesis UDP-glucose lipid carrier transferase
MFETASSHERPKSAAKPAEPVGAVRVATVHYLTPLILARPKAMPHISVAASRLKRLTDFLLASFALLVFLPLLLVIALGVRLESRGPILFRQRRTGLGGEIFTIYKFRTMTVMEDSGEIKHVTKDDVRVTPFGLILRKTSLDELPQLLNILKGDMSIVGPRPHAVSHDEHYGALIPSYTARFRARPGLTGLAQVSGFRGEIEDLSCMADRVDADNAYIDHWSLVQDVRIILKTVPLLFRDPNAY